MAEHPAAPGLAAKLGALPHTNARGERGLVHVPGFLLTTGSSPELVEQNGILGLAIAEGMIEAVGEDGFLVIHEDDIDAQAQELAAEKAPSSESRSVLCNRCRGVLFNLAIATGDPMISTDMVAMAIEAHRQVCE